MSFHDDGYEIVRGVISQQTARLLSIQSRILIDQGKDGPFYHADAMVNNCIACYGIPCYDALMLLLQPAVESIINKQVFPTYSYSRLYLNGSKLRKHRDRSSCEYSITITIDSPEEPWPIFIENYSGEVSSVILEAGDMIVYKGDQLTHWRDSYQGHGQLQCFCHYVDANGEFKHHRWDKRDALGTCIPCAIVLEETNGPKQWLD